jgi:predicted nucleotidyltransferase
MQPTAYPHINTILDHLLTGMQTILDGKLVGLYLFGSLVWGDFDDDLSDIDLLAAVTETLNEREFLALKKMQDAFVRDNPKWDNRVEIAYLSLHALKTFRTEDSLIGIISPGEPFHMKDAGKDWLVNWYMVREKGVTLYGPPPQEIIDPIAKAEFIQVVKDHMLWWRDYIHEVYHRGAQAYAILTMCRALYTVRNGEQVSKLQAATWVQGELPQWAALIQDAITWRKASRETNVDHAATIPQTQAFVLEMIERILA